MTWSIDRITIVGKLNDNIYYHTSNDVLILNFEQLMRLNEGNGYLKSVSNNSWQLVDQHDENIAYIEILKWQEGKGRIDFNPNKINQFLAGSMKNFIHDLFLDPHFSRADIACDMIDVPDEFITQYRVVDPVSFKPVYGRSGKLETAYWGSRASERQIRMYNKKLEQETKRKIVPKEIQSWWRLEMQLRRGKATDWHATVYADILKNDYGLTGITQVEFDARLVLNRVENDSKPRNRQQGELWVDTLENARGTKIEPSRLERGIERAKELLEKVIEIARTMSRGIGR